MKSPLKVLIYSSEEIYRNSGYEGRAEADLIAYRKDEHFYQIIKSKIPSVFEGYTCSSWFLEIFLNVEEQKRLTKEMNLD